MSLVTGKLWPDVVVQSQQFFASWAHPQILLLWTVEQIEQTVQENEVDIKCMPSAEVVFSHSPDNVLEWKETSRHPSPKSGFQSQNISLIFPNWAHFASRALPIDIPGHSVKNPGGVKYLDEKEKPHKKVFLVNLLSFPMSTLVKVSKQANFASESVLRKDSPKHRCDRSWSDGDGDKREPGDPECAICSLIVTIWQCESKATITNTAAWEALYQAGHPSQSLWRGPRERTLGKPYKNQMAELVCKRGWGTSFSDKFRHSGFARESTLIRLRDTGPQNCSIKMENVTLTQF